MVFIKNIKFIIILTKSLKYKAKRTIGKKPKSKLKFSKIEMVYSRKYKKIYSNQK